MFPESNAPAVPREPGFTHVYWPIFTLTPERRRPMRRGDEMMSKTIGYTTAGSVRGQCGHLHETTTLADRCLARDRAGCAIQGGYSDRQIARIDAEGFLYDLDGEWIAADGGPTNGAMRFSQR
jgi:hypothetical protein